MGQEQEKTSLGFCREVKAIVARGRQVWHLVGWPQKLALGAAVLVMSLASAANTSIPVLLGKMIDMIPPDSSPRPGLHRLVVLYLGLMGLGYIVRESLNVLRRYLVESTCAQIDKNLCVLIVSHLMKIDLSTLSQEQVGALHGRILRSIEGYVRFLRISFLDFFPAIFTGSFALMAALSRQPRIALIMAGVIPVSVMLTVWQLVTQKGIRLGLLRSRELMDGTVVEQLTGIDYIRAAHSHRQEIHRVAMAAEQRRFREVRHHFEMSLFGSGKALNEALFHLLVIAFAIYLFFQRSIGYGDIMMFSILFLNVMSPLNEIHRFVDEAHESSLRMGDLLEMLAEPTDRSFQPSEVREPRIEVGAPLFLAEGLQVTYRTADGRTRRALDGVSMSIRHGETIGVAGRSGCGKSTWLRVIMRLIHPSSGSAMLGGVPLECVSRESIGRLIGYVGQNPFIFAGTIAENIAYGNEGATPEQIERAARMACIHDEILEMPGGYQARVLERGQNLSGGQRQRLALARVFLKNPPILILDEGTSALDNISERNVQKAINAARADRTVILVAHRLSTLMDSNRIFVFDEGQIAETGTYDELVRRGGVFAELVRSAESGCLTPTGDGPAHEAIGAPTFPKAYPDLLETIPHADAIPLVDAIPLAEKMIA
ncbi:MAG: ABC transporter ATP-binding protein [Planctomycetaceae bacterium]|nr:ABC transporter ATP-binding protein [Planctomycetaceae bacterium]MBV8229392.1 ABC transporter ATP-binding protein [Planctomycetaceae bacterium]MBV8314760.1 ABC transporter ATP-binding protein [Planctomycetaceae bacterium]